MENRVNLISIRSNIRSRLLHDQPYRSEETPLVFRSGPCELYGILHRPREEAKDVGILICPPLFTEAMEAHGVLVNMARLMAENGYPVLRMDYRGCGESGGEWAKNSIAEYLEDIGAGIASLREKTGVRSIGVLGLRMGATLALMKLAGGMPEFAVAMEPVVQGGRYIRDLLRLNMAEQICRRTGIKTGVRDLLHAIERGEEVPVAGFCLNRMQCEAISAIDLVETARAIRSPVALFSLRNRQTPPEPAHELFGPRFTAPEGSVFREIPCPPFWRQTPILVRRIPELFGAVLEWLDTVAIPAKQH